METSTAIQRFNQLVSSTDEHIDAAECALTAAAALSAGVDVAAVTMRLADLAAGASKRFGPAETPLGQINALNEHLFDELGFAGDMDDYYAARNSLFLSHCRSCTSRLALVWASRWSVLVCQAISLSGMSRKRGCTLILSTVALSSANQSVVINSYASTRECDGILHSWRP
jgi:hypothetical protein